MKVAPGGSDPPKATFATISRAGLRSTSSRPGRPAPGSARSRRRTRAPSTVSNHSLAVFPRWTSEAASRRAVTGVPSPCRSLPVSLARSSRSRGVGPLALHREVGVDVRPHRLDDVDRCVERRHRACRRPATASSKCSGRMPRMTSRWSSHRSTACRHPVGQLGLAERRRHDPVALQLPGQEVHRRAADEPGHEQVARVVVQVRRRADLLHHAAAHDHDPVAERHRLGLVVGDVERGGAQASSGCARPACASARAAWRRGWTAARP